MQFFVTCSEVMVAVKSNLDVFGSFTEVFISQITFLVFFIRNQKNFQKHFRWYERTFKVWTYVLVSTNIVQYQYIIIIRQQYLLHSFCQNYIKKEAEFGVVINEKNLF